MPSEEQYGSIKDFCRPKKMAVITDTFIQEARDALGPVEGATLLSHLYSPRAGVTFRLTHPAWSEFLSSCDPVERKAISFVLGTANRGGIKTIDDLRRTPIDQLQGIKQMGMARIGFLRLVFGTEDGIV